MLPISIQIKKDMIKLLQKQNGAVFYASHKVFYWTFKNQHRFLKQKKPTKNR